MLWRQAPDATTGSASSRQTIGLCGTVLCGKLPLGTSPSVATRDRGVAAMISAWRARAAVMAWRQLRRAGSGGFPGVHLIMLLVAGTAVPAHALDTLVSAEQEIRRMWAASASLSYRGTAFYQQGGALTTLRLVRAVRDGGQRERIEYLDGPRSEVVSKGGRVGCVGVLRSGLPGTVETHYRVAFLDTGRIAGRPVSRIQLQPRDGHRYGRLLGIDRDTGLLLQTLTFDEEGQLLERFQFSDIAIGVVINEAELEPRLTHHRVVESLTCDSSRERASAPQRQWRASWVPPGFSVFFEGAVDELHYSDGFSAFSIFMEEGAGPVVEARYGPTMTHVSRLQWQDDSYRVCVVGEIPMSTARRIAASVEWVPAGSAAHADPQ